MGLGALRDALQGFDAHFAEDGLGGRDGAVVGADEHLEGVVLGVEPFLGGLEDLVSAVLVDAGAVACHEDEAPVWVSGSGVVLL